MQTETLHTRLADIASPEAITGDTPSVDGKRPGLSVAPSSASALAAVVAELARVEAATLIVGGGTMLDVGGPPAAADVALRTTGLDAVTGYEPADLIVTAEVGVTLADLQATLRAHNQTLPLDVPYPARATVGGVVAANAHGPLRYAFGTAKDLVMGLQFVQGDGTLVKSGGEVVKNVAGFGLHKLHVGALGTLGVITSATFKVHPLPDADVTLLCAFEDSHAAFAVGLDLRAHLPTAAAVMNEAAQQRELGEAHGLHVLLVRFLGGESAVARQARDAKATGTAAGATVIERIGPDTGAALWQECVDLGWEPDAPDAMFKASVVPTATHHVYGDLMRNAAAAGGEVIAVGDPLNGSLKCVVRQAAGARHAAREQKSSLEGLVGLVQHARAVSQEHGGSLVLQRGSHALKSACDVWGPHPQGLAAMRSIKRAFDPGHILNPGRFVGGI